MDEAKPFKQRPNIRSRVTREGHARFWERPEVKFLRATRRFDTFPWLAARSPAYGLAQVPPANLDILILGQLAPSQFPLDDALEPRPLEVVRFDAPLRGGVLRQ